MKKISILIICIAWGIVGCNNSDTQKKDDTGIANHLIPNTVSITYEQSMIVPQEYWFLKGIDFKSFVSELKDKTVSGKIPSFFPMSIIALTKQDIQEKFISAANPQGSGFSADEMKYLVFEEDWLLDTSKFIMNKKVTAYTLIREYIRTTRLNPAELTKSMVARYDFSKNKEKDFSKLTLLQKDVAYEVPLVNATNPEWLENIQVKHVINVLLAEALSGNEQAYSFMLRDTLTKLSVLEVKQRLGEETQIITNLDETTGETDSISVEKKIEPSEIVGIAFIEDWYIDKKTMQIYKDVKGIGLVREYTKYLDEQQSELARTIPFVMFFSNHAQGK